MKVAFVFLLASMFCFIETARAQQCGTVKPQTTESKPADSKPGDANSPQSPKPSPFAGQPPFPAQVAIGTHVLIVGKDLMANSPVSVALCQTTGQTPLKRLDGVITADGKALDFRVDDVAPQRYLVSVDMAGNTYDVPGELRVTQASAPHVEELKPNILYPVSFDLKTFKGNFALPLNGQNLGIDPRDVSVEVDGEGPIALEKTKSVCAAGKDENACVQINNDRPTGESLTVLNFPYHRGAKNVRVKVAGGPASNWIPVRFSLVPESYVRWVAWGTAGLILLLVLGVVLAGQHIAPAAAQQFVMDSLLLDTQSNTFSLSKFQLLLWTGVAIFAYIFLFVSRNLVQGTMEMPPIPDGLPNLLALSVGTTVLSSGITGIRGSKGAGPEEPSFADLFTTGGMVVGERLQFFLWTVVGVIGFIGIVLISDPATLTELPTVPPNFLPLMGISALGYLGGKVARKPGPVIKTLAITKVDDAAHTMTMTLQGENLSSNATFQMDDQLLLANSVVIKPVKTEDTDTNLYIAIELLFQNADSFTIGTHSLKFINPDGQVAIASFPLNAMTITIPDGGYKVKGGVTEVELEVTGENFDANTKAQWKPLGVQTPSAATVAFDSASKIHVRFNPGPGAGKGQLTLISQVGLKAVAEVLVM